jgi:MFS family permease
VVVVLMVVYVFSFVDRQILNLLVTPIKADLEISDSQMSYLMGFSFAILYTVMGLPFGRIADSGNRIRLVAAGLAVWSVMTAGCGVARRYLQFLLLRIGVGVGEATLSPAAYSVITDLFPKQKLGRALSLYSMGIYFVSFPIGAAAAAIQNIMPNAMRGQASALYLFATNLIGLGIGPSAVAWCTDYLFRDEMMVGYSILIVGVSAHVIAVFAF